MGAWIFFVCDSAACKQKETTTTTNKTSVKTSCDLQNLGSLILVISVIAFLWQKTAEQCFIDQDPAVVSSERHTKILPPLPTVSCTFDFQYTHHAVVFCRFQWLQR